MMCLCDCTDICSESYLIDFLESKFFQRFFHISLGHILAKLSDIGRCQFCDDLIPLRQCTGKLEDLRLVRNCAKWAIYHTHTTRYAFVIINLGASHLIGTDCSYATCHRTWALFFSNCIVWTCGFTFTTLNTFTLINKGLTIHKGNCALRTDFHTRMCQTSFTHIADLVSLCLTCFTC